MHNREVHCAPIPLHLALPCDSIAFTLTKKCQTSFW